MGNLDPLLIQLLEWIAARPRTYGDAMEAWRTSCPRMPIWEDAVGGGLLELGEGGGLKEATVRLTPKGLALLRGQGGEK